ncbi:MAG: NAD(P)H-dependent oxidoreductase subunit E [Deltaproteobacteria bacterium]|nr:NAD(P)H-dependent oxidoreductase subunit E [Deltaproteobacteria bacterium]
MSIKPAVDLKIAEQILARYPAEPRHLISVLQDCQLAYRYLPREVLELVARRLAVPIGKVYGVATFYKAFSLTPRGEKVLRVCTGTACHIRGAPLILNELCSRLRIKPGETTGDLKYSIEAVNCVGACALAPVVVVNDVANGQVNVTKARRLIGVSTAAAKDGN